MANISLYYIEGINKEDTPYFSSKEEQESYFSTCIVAPIEDDGFYPPYYQNEIKLSTDNLSTNTKANYLSLYYEGKYYYYFINNISYISQDVISISIEMDTIQTYMFDIFLQSGIIQRKFINRYNFSLANKEYLINRNYIRENFSKGTFQIAMYDKYYKSIDFKTKDLTNQLLTGFESTRLNEDETEFVIIFKCSDEINANKSYERSMATTQIFRSSYTYNSAKDNDQQSIGSYVYYMLPFNKDILTNGEAIIYDSGNQADPVTVNFWESFYSIAKEPVVMSCYAIPLNCFRWISTKGHNVYGADSVGNMGGYYIISWDGNVGKCGVLRIQDLTILYSLLDKFSFGFGINKDKAVPFYYDKVPALLDENYVRVSFGESDNSTTFPVHLVSRDNFILEYCFDCDGSRYYNILPFKTSSNENGLDNTYLTLLTAKNLPSYDLLSDKWQEYLAYNKATIPMTILSNGVTALTGINPAVLSYVNDSRQIDSLLSNPDSYDKRYKIDNRPLRKGPRAQYNSLQEGKLNAVGDMVSTAGQSAIDTANQLLPAINSFLAPITSKVVGDATSDMFSKACLPRLTSYEVDDIKMCGLKYHLYGYRVDENVNNVENIFKYVNTRYYYNYLKMSTCNIHLNLLEIENATDDTSYRLKAGIRLWNVENSDVVMGDTQYDNVEKSLLEVQNG